MAGETSSPNMNMPIPGVGITDGPQYAIDLDDCLDILDAHDHTLGNGVQITPSGLNINADLSVGINNLTLARSVRFAVQSAPISGASDLGCVYSSGVDLYFNDGNGNQVRITQSGAVAGTPGSIANLVSPASASYVAGSATFVWQSAATTAANMDAGSVILRNITAGSFGLTLSPPSLSSNYTVTLPPLPASTKIMALDASGNITAPYTTDNITLSISGNLLQVLDGGITKPKLAPLGQQISSSSGSFTTSSGSFTDVTSVSVSLTTTGRPVWVGLVGAASVSPVPCIGVSRNGASTGIEMQVALIRDVTALTVAKVANYFPSATGVSQTFQPPGSIWVIDTPGAGTYTYKLQARLIAGDAAVVTEVKLVAYEID